jgi:outer membrane protein
MREQFGAAGGLREGTEGTFVTRVNTIITALIILLVGSTGANAQSFPIRHLFGGGVSQLTPLGSRFDLTLDDAIERALDRNLDIAVQRINPQVQDLTIASANSAFLPTLTSNFRTQSSTSPQTSQLDGSGQVTDRKPIVTDSGVWDVEIGQQVKWGGGSYTAGWNNSRTDTTNVFLNFNPSYRANFSAQYTQPILRGFNTDPARRQLVVSQLNRDISDIDLEETIANILADVRSAYWDLRYAIASLAVQEQALALAEQLVSDNRTRVEIGTLAPIDVVQAQSEAAARRQAVAAATQLLRTAELALKRLIVEGTEDELWRAELIPVDQPVIVRAPIDVDAAVDRALADRTDISRTRRQQDINEVTLGDLKNQTMPSLNVVGGIQLQGQGGAYSLRNGLGGPIVLTVPGGLGDAIDNIVDADFPVWNVGLQLSYPIGQSSQRASYARAELQVQQTSVQIRQIELQIATEVTNAALQIDAIQERIAASTAARELAEEQLTAEESKFEIGSSINFFVVQAQRDLATAQDTELRAILDFQNALIEFDRVQHTSLNRAGISIVGGGGGF